MTDREQVEREIISVSLDLNWWKPFLYGWVCGVLGSLIGVLL